MTRIPAAVCALVCLGAHCSGGVEPPAGGPELALKKLAERSERHRNLRGFASVTGWDSETTFKGKLLVVAERPGRVHIQVLSPFDQPIAYLATDGVVLDLYLLNDGRFLRGAATAENLARLIPMHIEPAVLVQALLGGPPLPHEPGQPPALRWDPRAAVYVLTYGKGPWPAAWLRPDDLAAVQAGWLAPGEGRRWSLELWDHEAGAPRRLAFEHRASGSGFRMTWDQVEFDVADLPAETWRIEVPRGVEVEPLAGVPAAP